MVRESVFQPYFGDRDIRGDEFSACVLDSEAPHIFADGLAVGLPKAARQMNRMHPGRLRSLSQGHPFPIAGTQERNYSVHPRELPYSFARRLWSEQFGENLQDQSFHRECCAGVRSTELLVEPMAESSCRPSRALYAFREIHLMNTEPMDADGGELDAQNASTSASKLIGMRLARGA